MTSASRAAHFALISAAVLLASVSVFLFSVPPAHAVTADCSSGVSSTTVVNVHQQISNDPDSSVPGATWALDNFDRHIQIWAEGDHYCGEADDSGTFTTLGGASGISPQSGHALPEVVTGSMTGSTHGKLVGTFGDAGAWAANPPAVDCTATPAICSSGLTSYWVSNYFAGGSYDYGNNWGWTYDGGTNGSWTNAASGNSGDILHIVPTTVYVDASGSDSNDGSQAHPFQTIQAAVNAVADGGTVHLASDVTISAAVTLDKAVTLDGGAFTLKAPFAKTSTSNNAAIEILHSDVTIQNLIEDGTGSTNLHGINIFEATSTVLLDGVTVSNNTASGVTVNGSTVTVHNITTQNNAWGGINVDQAADAPDPTSLTVTGTSIQNETGPDIWRDDNSKAVTVTDGGNQYASQTYTHDAGIVGTVFTLKSAVVYSAAELTAAIADPLVETITFGSDITTTAEITVSRGVTIDGAGHTLFAPIDNTANNNSNNAGLGIVSDTDNVTVKNLTVDGTGSIKTHGINIFDGQSVTLDGVTSQNNSKSGITVNGGNVTVNDVTTKNNAWGGINADLASDATSTATVLTVTGTSVYSETGPQIWRDDNAKNVTVNVGSEYSSKTYASGATTTGTIWGLNSATVNSSAELTAALNNSLITTITFGSDIQTTAELDITRSVTIDGAGHTLTTTASGVSVINITANDVTIKNLVENGAGSSNNRGINIYEVTGITLDTVTAENNAKNGIVVNGSTVTVNNITTSGNGWEGIDVDMGSGVTTLASLTVNGTSLHNETKAAIRIDDTSKVPTPTVVDSNNQYRTSTVATTTDYFLKAKNVKIVTATTQTSTGSVAVTVDIPAGTIVSGDSSWDGTVNPPTVTSVSVSTPGFNTDITSAIAVGSNDSDLTFDQPVKLTFAGQAGKRVGWYNHAGTFTEITDTCNSLTSPTLAAGASCKIDSGSDLIVWTKHFSTFMTYTQTAVSPTPSGGGGGGGVVSGSVAVSTSGSAPSQGNTPSTNSGATGGGEVLGAAAYNFTQNLTVGSTGQDVTELQKILIAEGDLAISAPTGYFGALTKAAVVKYQTAHNISPQSGYVGPLTRAVLNQGVVSTTPETSGTQTLTDAQIQAIVGLLQSFNADASVIANVEASLKGR